MSNKTLGRQLGRRIALQQRMGRPLLEGEPLTQQINFRLSDREAQNLQQYCWRYDLRPSEVIRDALRLLSITGF